ncbi:MAG: Kelch repeat-containing protein [Gemmatimonadaceae bacterium]
MTEPTMRGTGLPTLLLPLVAMCHAPNGVAVEEEGSFAPDSLVAVGNMTAARAAHTAPTLSDGRVLFVGGVTTNWTFLATAELFDPAANRFVATGLMSVPRESHVGVLLADGTVLVAGGHSGRRENIQIYASAERYDPERGVFVPIATMTKRRRKHAGITLPNGRVLVTGGADERDDRGQYRDVETFDPATGRFTRLGEMQRARYKHDGSMVLLRDGSVLLAGGAAEAELLDQSSNGFRVVRGAAGLPGSFSAAAQLRDGSVLITGGYGNGANARTSAWLFALGAR